MCRGKDPRGWGDHICPVQVGLYPCLRPLLCPLLCAAAHPTSIFFRVPPPPPPREYKWTTAKIIHIYISPWDVLFVNSNNKFLYVYVYVCVCTTYTCVHVYVAFHVRVWVSQISELCTISILHGLYVINTQLNQSKSDSN